MSFARARDHCRISKGVSNVFLNRFYTSAEVNGAGVGLANIMVASFLEYFTHASSVAPSPQHSQSAKAFVFSMSILRGCILSCPSEG